jgi:two-component system chemotaxis response regulator CheB
VSSVSEHSHPFNSPGVPAHTGPFDVVVIGASFGGPKAVERVLSELPRRFPVPIVICQHITAGMTGMWAERLNHVSASRVREAKHRSVLEPGFAYIGPAGLQMRVEKGPMTVGNRIRLDPDFADSLHVPSIDILFSSAAKAFGPRVLGVLLTGMGSDGASGMLAIRQAGGCTIAESEETAASYSMPGSAVAAGAVVQELALEHIGARIIELGSHR